MPMVFRDRQLPVSAIADIEGPFRLHDFQGLTDVVFGIKPSEVTDTFLKTPSAAMSRE